MVSYSYGVKFTPKDYETMRDIIDITEKALIYINDYFSWYREKEISSSMAGRMVNVISFFMRKESLLEGQAREKVKNLVLEYESRYVRERDRLYNKHPQLPLHLRKWTEMCGCVIAGSHFWSANCPRYNYWNKTDGSNSAIQRIEPTMERVDKHTTPAIHEDIYFHTYQYCLPTPNQELHRLPLHLPLKRRREETTTNNIVKKSYASGYKGPTKSPKFNNVHNGHAYVSRLGAAKGRYGQMDGGSLVLHDNSHGLKLSALLAPCDYINSLPSKGVRSKLVDGFNVWLNVSEKGLAMINRIIKNLHNSSLILDDIEDNSPLRRGKTATHIIFGREQAINSATYLFVSAAQEIHATGNSDLTAVMLEELQNLFVGQSWDLYWKFSMIPPSEEDYLAMIEHKTGAMFRMLVRLMQAASPLISQYDFDPLVQAIGRFYQIRDDYMNLQAEEYSSSKGFCEDLDEGKFSYPVVHCLNHYPRHRDLILGILRQRQAAPGTPLMAESKRQILSSFTETGTFGATLQLLRQLEEEIEQEIEILESQTGEANPILRLLIKALSVAGVGCQKGEAE
jgi:ophiobolin F synthase